MIDARKFAFIAISAMVLWGCGGGTETDSGTGPAATDAGAAGANGDAASTPGGNALANADTGADAADAAPGGFDTPEAAFAGVQQAVEAKDWKAAAQCMTEDSQETMTMGLVLVTGLMVAFGGEGEEMKGIAAVLERHGVSDGPPVQIEVTPGEAPPSNDGETEMPIKDKPAFIGEMLAALEKTGEGFDEGPAKWAQAELTNLVVEGETATAALVHPDEEEPEEIAFRQVAGRWFVEIPPEAFQGAGGPMVGPGPDDGGAFPTEDADDELQKDYPEETVEDGLTSNLNVWGVQPFEIFGDYPEGSAFAKLELTGDLIETAFGYGLFQLTKVTDDTGKELELAVPVKNQFDHEFGEQFIELNHFFLDDPSTLPLQFVLTAPADGAKTVSLEGSLKIKARSSVIISDLADKLGKPLTAPKELVDLGQVVLSKPDNADNGLKIVAEGKAVAGATLLDGEGNALETSGTSTFGFGRETTIEIQTEEALPDDAQVRLTLVGSERTWIVPLKFEDVAISNER